MSGPLTNLKVVEFTHMVMGPAAGHILASLGAKVTRVEPIGGDATRNLMGSGAGYFPMYNRHKGSICLDLKSEEGIQIAKELCCDADIIIENFRPNALNKLGLSYEELSAKNARIIYCSLKGFLPGPYENRTALDEVAQMMGGLAYMTGPPGRPLRAGASVIDVTGGMFGVIAILAAIEERHSTGKGQKVSASLFETTIYLIGQHMAQFAVTGQAASPMPARISAWAIYDVFETHDDKPIFIGIVTDGLWEKFCNIFGFRDLWNNLDYRMNNARVLARDVILPIIRKKMLELSHANIVEKLNGTGIPFAAIGRPEDMFEDPHLNQSGALEEVRLYNGESTKLPKIPLKMNSVSSATVGGLAVVGESTYEVLRSLGRSEEQILHFLEKGIVQ